MTATSPATPSLAAPILALPPAAAAAHVLRRVLDGHGAVLAGEAGPVLHNVLDNLAASLAEPLRVLRADARGGMGVSGFMAAITGQSDLGSHDDAVLEQGFRALASPGGTVLLVAGADGLQRPVLRCLELACRNAPTLRVVLAGADALPAVLDGAGLQTLRARVGADTPVAVGPASLAPPLPVPPVLAPPVLATPVLTQPVLTSPVLALVPDLPPAAVMPDALPPVPRIPLAPRAAAAQGRRLRGWAAAGLGAAAFAALGAWIVYAGSLPVPPPGPAVAVAEAGPVPADAPPAALAAAPATEPAPGLAPAPAVEAPPDSALPLPPPAAPPPPATTPTPARRRAEPRPRDAVAQAPRRPAPRAGDAAYAGAQPAERSAPAYPPPPPAYIGTYTINPDGTRAFRMER